MRNSIFFLFISIAFCLANQLYSQSNEEPQVLLGSGLTSVSGFGGLGYRFVTGINNSEFNVTDYNSPEFTLSFLFGWFKDY